MSSLFHLRTAVTWRKTYRSKICEVDYQRRRQRGQRSSQNTFRVLGAGQKGDLVWLPGKHTHKSPTEGSAFRCFPHRGYWWPPMPCLIEFKSAIAQSHHTCVLSTSPALSLPQHQGKVRNLVGRGERKEVSQEQALPIPTDLPQWKPGGPWGEGRKRA